VKKVLVLNLDSVKNKNLFQFNEMNKYGYQYVVFSYVNLNGLSNDIEFKNYKYKVNVFSRVYQVFGYMIKNIKKIHHVELYTGGGNFLIIEYLFSKLFFIPVVVAERGSPLKDLNSYYKGIGNWGRKFIYKFSNKVWIRELWMVDELSKVREKNYFFLSNAISISDRYNFNSTKEITFTWMNSLKKWRNVSWFIDILNSNDFKFTKNILMGLMDSKNKDVASQERYVVDNKPNNLCTYNFGDTDRFAYDAKFFILPADIVYLNFSLIESMGKGIVPIISDVDGSRDIVDDGVNGFIAPHSKEGLCETMKKAMLLPDDEYEVMSRNAREKVKKDFSMKSWAVKLNQLYESI
jgi:glycosyltransferase involved in cell wall biosynthesis